MYRCISDSVLHQLTLTDAGVDVIDGLRISLSQGSSGSPSHTSADVQVKWDGESSDIPFMVQLFAHGLSRLSQAGMSAVRQSARGQKFPFMGLPQLQMSMRLGMIRNHSLSLPELRGVSCKSMKYQFLCFMLCALHVGTKLTQEK